MNCKCRKRLINTLVEKCDEDIDRNKRIDNSTLHDFGLNEKVCKSCMLDAILLIITCILIIIGITSAYLYFYRYVNFY